MRLETARTIIRGWSEEDIPAYVQIVADPEVMRFIWDGSTQNTAQATAFVQNFIHKEQERGWIPWASVQPDRSLSYLSLTVILIMVPSLYDSC